MTLNAALTAVTKPETQTHTQSSLPQAGKCSVFPYKEDPSLIRASSDHCHCSR